MKRPPHARPALPRQVDLLSEEMAQAQTGGPPMPLTVVFVERKNKCDDVVVALRSRHIPAAALHGGLGQVRARRRACVHVRTGAQRRAEARGGMPPCGRPHGSMAWPGAPARPVLVSPHACRSTMRTGALPAAG